MEAPISGSNAPSTLVVTFKCDDRARDAIARAIGDAGTIVYLTDVPAGDRAATLESADVALAFNTGTDLAPGEAASLAGARLIQFISAGVDFIPLANLPDGVPVACNGGGYAEPMAEHGLAMALAAMKRLFVEHDKMRQGTFDQFRRNRMLAGSVCGILGFGGIGIATARVMRALGARIYAVNRRGSTDEPVDWIGTVEQQERLFREADVLVLSAPLTPATERMIDASVLAQMKPDAILVNLARGEIIDEAALWSHLKANPDFTACIDAWWIEPVRHGEFRTSYDFLNLPNVIGSPHNSASAFGWYTVALARAANNARRALVGETPSFIVPPADRMM